MIFARPAEISAEAFATKVETTAAAPANARPQGPPRNDTTPANPARNLPTPPAPAAVAVAAPIAATFPVAPWAATPTPVICAARNCAPFAMDGVPRNAVAALKARVPAVARAIAPRQAAHAATAPVIHPAS